MKRKQIILIVIIAAISGWFAGVAYNGYQKQKLLLPADLRKKFRCDRITLDWLPTDKYCQDYELYKRDHAAGLI